MTGQRGGFALGVVVGLLVGLSIALGVALYITKAPVPFVNKVPQRTVEQDQAEQARNKNWDPNAPLAGKPPRTTAAAASAAASASDPAAPAAVVSIPAPASAPARPGRDPAAILSGAVTPGPASAPARAGAEAFFFFVQAGAYTRQDEAEQQRAKLALLGMAARITEREQNGRVVYRVSWARTTPGPRPTACRSSCWSPHPGPAGARREALRNSALCFDSTCCPPFPDERNSMKRRDFSIQLAGAGLSLALATPAFAQAPVEGTHYIKLAQPVPPSMLPPAGRSTSPSSSGTNARTATRSSRCWSRGRASCPPTWPSAACRWASRRATRWPRSCSTRSRTPAASTPRTARCSPPSTARACG